MAKQKTEAQKEQAKLKAKARNITKLIMNDDRYVAVTTLDIAEITGKLHKNVLADTRALIEEVGCEDCVTVTRKDSGNRQRPVIEISNVIARELMSRYNNKRRLSLSAKEKLAVSVIEQLLGYELDNQYAVAGYRIDAYDHHTGTAYEIDEAHHRYQAEADKARELAIKNELSSKWGIECKFVRIKV